MKQTDIPEHLSTETFSCHGFPVSKVSVLSEMAAKQLGKTVGDYYTIETGDLRRLSSGRVLGNCLAELLASILSPYFQKTLCICGLGHQKTVCDSLGPATVDRIPALFLEKADTAKTGRFARLVTVKPGVCGGTNLETEAMVSGLAAAARADCLLFVDSIGTHDKKRLCNNIQLSTAWGTTHCMTNKTTDWSILGIPVISIGVPVVWGPLSAGQRRQNSHWFMHSDIQDVIQISSAILAYAVTKVSFPAYQDQDYFSIIELTQAPPLVW